VLNRAPYLYRTEWAPPCMPGDIAVLLLPGSPLVMQCQFVEELPKLLNFDLAAAASVATGTSSAVQQLQNASNQDVLAVGPDEWMQSRVELDPLDWLDTSGTTQPAQLTIWQPGAGQGRLLTLYAQAFQDIRSQQKWPSLNGTEIWSWYNQTPQYQVTNNTGVTLTHARLNAYGWHYGGRTLGSFDPVAAAANANDSNNAAALKILAMAAQAPYGAPMYFPAGQQQFRRAVNQPVS
jgi:hypothetical protein